MNTAFSINYIVTPDVAGRNMSDFIWQCTRLSADGETVRYFGETKFYGQNEWGSDADQIWPIPSLEDEAEYGQPNGDQAGEHGMSTQHAAARFVSERLQQHIAGEDAALASLIRTVSAETFDDYI